MNEDTTQPTEKPTRPWKDILLYGLARLLLFFALIVALPLSMFLFKGLRRRVTTEMATWNEQRRAHKEYIKSQLEDRE